MLPQYKEEDKGKAEEQHLIPQNHEQKNGMGDWNEPAENANMMREANNVA